MARRKSSQAGFSLAELLVAILILAVGLLGLAEMQISAMHDNTLASAALGANSVAQAAVEEIMSVNSKTPQLPVVDNPLYNIIHTLGTDQPWPTIPTAVEDNYLIRNDMTIEGSGRFIVTYSTTRQCPAPSMIGNTYAEITVNVVSQADRFGRGRARLTTVKNCSM